MKRIHDMNDKELDAVASLCSMLSTAHGAAGESHESRQWAHRGSFFENELKRRDEADALTRKTAEASKAPAAASTATGNAK